MRRNSAIKVWLFFMCSFVLAFQPAHADVVTDWNQTALNASLAAGVGGAIQSRNLA